MGVFCAPAWAAEPEGQMAYSGTGFFVSGDGYIITNNHVIDGCANVTIRGSVPEDTAKVIAVDKEFDLALLRTNARVRRVATIRHPDETKIKIGEPVLVMGYPLESYKTGQYKIAESTVIGLKGPSDEPFWIQFSDSAQQGNSGGPLLDSAGNVAGVIVAKSQRSFFNAARGREEVVSNSDIAISLPILMKFLDKNFVTYRFNGSYGYLMASRVEELAKAYIVNIICVPGAPR